MLKNKIQYVSNVSSNTTFSSSTSSSIPNSLFDLMKENVLIINAYESINLNFDNKAKESKRKKSNKL